MTQPRTENRNNNIIRRGVFLRAPDYNINNSNPLSARRRVYNIVLLLLLLHHRGPIDGGAIISAPRLLYRKYILVTSIIFYTTPRVRLVFTAPARYDRGGELFLRPPVSRPKSVECVETAAVWIDEFEALSSTQL